MVLSLFKVYFFPLGSSKGTGSSNVFLGYFWDHPLLSQSEVESLTLKRR